MSTLQDSLYGTDCHLAPPPRRHTPLSHPQLPGDMRSLLRGSLAITTTGLSPASGYRLSRHTTHVMACTLAESLNDPLHRKLRQLRCLRRRFDCYRVERTSSRAGVAPAEVQRLSRRTLSSISHALALPPAEALPSPRTR